MEPQDRLTLYRGMHDFEHGRQVYLKSSTTGVLTLLALLTGGLFFYIRNLPVLGWRGTQVTFVFLLLVASGSILLAILFVARAWWREEYGFVASPGRLERWFSSLREYAAEHGKGDAWMEEQFVAYLVREVGTVTEHNRSENATVSRALYTGKGFMLAALFCLALNLPVYYFCVYTFGKAQAPASASSNRNEG